MGEPLVMGDTQMMCEPQSSQLPRSDWLLLPLLSLLTMGSIALAGRLAARQLYWTIPTSSNSCMVLDDPSTGVRGMPNTSCRGKYFEESAPVIYTFNRCGHRAAFECGPKPPGTYRIVLVGSSYAEGANVSLDQSIAGHLSAQLSTQLSALTGRKVEVYNEGLHWKSPRTISMDFAHQAIQSEQPDLILWIVTPWDVENADFLLPKQEWLKAKEKPAGIAGQGSPSSRLWLAVKGLVDGKDLDLVERHTRYWFTHAPEALLVQHYLYLSQSIYLDHYLDGGETNDFLKMPRSSAFTGDLAGFDKYFGQAMDLARRQPAPVVVTLLPQRGQAAMISRNQWATGYDPYQLGNDIGMIAAKHGASYIDILSSLRTVPNPEANYLPNDGHPKAEGYRILSGLLAQKLIAHRFADGMTESRDSQTRLQLLDSH